MLEKPKGDGTVRSFHWTLITLTLLSALGIGLAVYLFTMPTVGKSDLFYLSTGGTGSAINLWAMDTDVENASAEALSQFTVGYGIYSYGISPDAQWIVYTAQEELEGQATGNSVLIRLDLQNRQTNILYTCQSATCTGLQMNPQRPEFFYLEISRQSGASKVWRGELINGALRQAEFPLERGTWLSAWATEDVVRVESMLEGSYFYNPATQSRVTVSDELRYVQLAPDGQNYVGILNEEIAANPADRFTEYRIGNLETATTQDFKTVPHDGNNHLLQWKADSSGFVYYHLMRSQDYAEDLGSEVWFYDVATQTPNQLFASSSNVAEIAWRKDGSQLVAAVYPAGAPQGAESQLWLYDFASAHYRPLNVSGAWLQWAKSSPQS